MRLLWNTAVPGGLTYLAVAVFLSGCQPALTPDESLDAPLENRLELFVPELERPAVPWDHLLDQQGGTDVTFGVTISGPSAYERNATRLFAPASTTKLFSAGIALDRLGPNFRFETRLEWQRVQEQDPSRIAELRMIGTGDPSWAMDPFETSYTARVDEFVQGLRQAGVTEVHGPITVASADPRMDTPTYPSTWELEDHTACYGALTQGFNLQENCATFVVTSRTRGAWKEKGIAIPVELRISSGASTHLNVVEKIGATGFGFQVTGTFATGAAPASFVLPVNDVRSWVKNLLTDSLLRHGIRWSPQKLPELAIGSGSRSLSFFSRPLAELLVPILKRSINMGADGVFRVVGSRFGDSDINLWDASIGVMRSYLARLARPATVREPMFAPSVGPFEDVVLWDGSGVSRENKLSARSMMALLQRLVGTRDFLNLWNALPIAGVDGTLANRMKGTAAEGRLRAKTGSLRGWYNLSGWAPKPNAQGGIQEYVPFVVLATTDSANRQKARDAQDRVGAALTELLMRGENELP